MKKNRYLAILLLNGSDNHCYRKLKANIYNEHLIKNYVNPKTYK